jgi:hypothetical protein
MKMPYITSYLKTIGFMLILLSGVALYAQKDCKVLMPEISGTYKGKCRKGLAHGNGVAEGTDIYEGKFSKGLPHGKGKYTWADGRVFEGSFSEGKIEGKGTMIYPTARGDSIVAGIWNDMEYLGPVPVAPYKIGRTRSVVRSSIKKLNEVGSGVRIGIFLGGNFNTEISDFSMAYDSGEEIFLGQRYGLQNAAVPYTVTIRYRTWNHLRTQQHDVLFEFTINEPGTFEVSIHN